MFWQPHDRGLTLAIRVSPRSSQSRIVGAVGNELKVSLHAPPAEGQANKELIQLLAKTFSIPKSCIEILSGETARSKRVLFRGINAETLSVKLNTYL